MMPVLEMTCLSLGSKRSHASIIESTASITLAEASLTATFGAIEIADDAHRTAPMRYAKEENDVSSKVNSRQSNSSSVLGSGMSCPGLISKGYVPDQDSSLAPDSYSDSSQGSSTLASTSSVAKFMAPNVPA